MVPPTVRRFLSEKFCTCVSACLLHRFFKQYGDLLPKVDLGDGSEAAKRRRLRPVLDALDDPKAARVVQDIQRIALFCREPAFTALQERVNAQRRTILWLHPEATIHDRRAAVLRLFIDHPDLFDHAEEWLAVRFGNCCHELQGLYPRDIDYEDPAREKFELAARALYGELCGENYCRVAWHEDGPRLAIVLFHGDLPTATVAIEGQAEVPLNFRELEESLLVYNIDTARLQVTGRTSAERKQLVDLFARVIVGDEMFFQHRDAQNLYQLDRLAEEAGAFRLADPNPEFLSQRVVEVQARSRGNSDRVVVVRDNVNAVQGFLAFTGSAGMEGWEIQHVVLRLELMHNGRRVVRRVYLRPPDLARYMRDGCEGQLSAYLYRNGFCHVAEQLAAAVYM